MRVNPPALLNGSLMASDEELMLAVSEGDLGAFEEIVRRHCDSAWRTAYRFIGDPAEAEDLVQDAFLRILGAARRYQPTAKFRTYLYCVLTRLCSDWKRRGKPSYSASLPDEEDYSPSTHERMLTQERDRAIQAALDHLPPAQRMATILRHFEGLSNREIGCVLKKTEKAVERLLARARTALAVSLTEWLKK
jgi:RNA polymerase sigma-70 factor (ECF subfamily)